MAPSKFITQVAEALIPILCSMEPQETALRAPTLPSASGRNFGTMNSEIPLVPAGASLASTRWTMFSLRSCSPAEMNIFVPLIAWLPSAFGTARVLMMPRSVPQCGSVRHMVPVQVPAVIRAR